MAFNASLLRVTDPKLRNMTHALSLIVFIAFKETNFYILFASTAAGVVSCAALKSPRTTSIATVQIIFYFWSFVINGNILRIQKLYFCQDSNSILLFDPL